MKPFSYFLASLLTLLVIADRLHAKPIPDALQVEMDVLAKDIARIVDKNGGGSIAIGEFTGSVDVVGHAGPVVQQKLAAALEDAGLAVVSDNHKFEVAGRYQPFKDTRENRIATNADPRDATGLNAVKLVAYLVDQQTGDFLAEKPTGRLIFGHETVPAMLGLNTSNPPLRDPLDLSKNFEKAQKDPQIQLLGSTIQGETGRYAIEVLVKNRTGYVPREITMHDRSPFVGLKVSEVYGIRLINNSKHEAAVDLRIDGVNCFAFSDSKSKFWIVKPNSHVDILGWHRNDEKLTEFKVVSNFPETAAAKLKLKPSSKIGLITAHFSACWKSEEDRPADEPLVQGRGTGFGDDIEFQSQQVSRTIGQVRDNLAVRYER